MKSEWNYRGVTRRDFRSGAVDPDDFEEEVPYRKNKHKYWARRPRACRRSKTGEVCNFTVKKVIGTYKRYDYRTETYYNAERTILTCERCGRYSWGSYNCYI